MLLLQIIVNDNVMVHEELAACHIEVIAFASNLIVNDNFMLHEEPHYDPTCRFFISSLLIHLFFLMLLDASGGQGLSFCGLHLRI